MAESTATAAKPAEFTITRVFDAPRELVWRAWTDPDEAPHWLHPAHIITPRALVDFDVRPGGRYRYTMIDTDGTEYVSVGRYHEVEPPARLVLTWGSPGDADDAMPVITVDLAEHGPDGRQTLMTFHLAGIAGRPGDQNVYDGWSQAFDLLASWQADRARH